MLSLIVISEAMLSSTDLPIVGLAGLGAGFVNAIAGGGSLISFPALTAMGLPPLMANVTSTVALLPGYGGAVVAQCRDLRGQRGRVLMLIPATLLGGLLGGALLLTSGEELFRHIVPWLILFGSVLLALQSPLRRWLLRHKTNHGRRAMEAWATLPVFLAAVYGGYFGAGLSVILLATLALFLQDTLNRINGLKQFLALQANVAAAVLFCFFHQVNWAAAVVMATGSVLGGALGGRLGSQINPDRLRLLVVILGFSVAIVFFTKI